MQESGVSWAKAGVVGRKTDLASSEETRDEEADEDAHAEGEEAASLAADVREERLGRSGRRLDKEGDRAALAALALAQAAAARRAVRVGVVLHGVRARARLSPRASPDVCRQRERQPTQAAASGSEPLFAAKTPPLSLYRVPPWPLQVIW